MHSKKNRCYIKKISIKFVFQPEGTFIEWKVEEKAEGFAMDNHSEQDWAMISSVGYQPDRGSDTSQYSLM